MPAERLEHYLVLSEDIERTKDFYCEALGMTVGFRPELDFPGYWLYLGETPCIHIAEWETYKAHTNRTGVPMSTPAPGTGPVDHVAFNASGYEDMLARLRRLGAQVSTNLVGDIGMRQLFTKDPNGVTIELNFRRGSGGDR